jgi:hypothetical protein
MPQNKFAHARYAVIDELLQKNHYVKTSQMADTCRRNLGYDVSQRTIQLDMHSMKHDTFLGLFAPIAYCTRRKAYYYEDRDYGMLSPVMDQGEIRLLESVCTMAEVHLHPEQSAAFQKIVLRIKKRYMAK